MMEYEFHPLAMEYRRMSPHDLGRMEEAMIEYGFDPRFPIVLYEGKILDGCNRYLASNKADVKPKFVTFKGTYEEARLFVQVANEERRHLTDAELAQKRQTRIARVAELRAEGQSTRQIAETLGVSKSTVHADLNESPTGVQPRTPDKIPATGKHKKPKPPAKVTGKDGKEYPSTKEPKSELPKSVQNALADTWHADCARTLSKIRTQCKTAFSWSSWLDASVLEHLQAAEDCFTTAIPRRVCPDCNGKKVVEDEACLTCRQGGYLASQV